MRKGGGKGNARGCGKFSKVAHWFLSQKGTEAEIEKTEGYTPSVFFWFCKQ